MVTLSGGTRPAIPSGRGLCKDLRQLIGQERFLAVSHPFPCSCQVLPLASGSSNRALRSFLDATCSHRGRSQQPFLRVTSGRSLGVAEAWHSFLPLSKSLKRAKKLGICYNSACFGSQTTENTQLMHS